jgi:predicted lipoprotein
VKSFWAGPVRADEGATDVTTLWEAFAADPSNARTEHGHQAGLGGPWYFCVRGQGVVETVEKNRVLLAVAGSSRQVGLDLDVVVDNTVREALGVKASAFADSQDFNAVSSELNRRVEQEVITPNRPLLKPGAEVEFVGCTKIGGNSDLDPLCLVPIRLHIPSNEGSTEGGDGGPAP